MAILAFDVLVNRGIVQCQEEEENVPAKKEKAP